MDRKSLAANKTAAARFVIPSHRHEPSEYYASTGAQSYITPNILTG